MFVRHQAYDSAFYYEVVRDSQDHCIVKLSLANT